MKKKKNELPENVDITDFFLVPISTYKDQIPKFVQGFICGVIWMLIVVLGIRLYNGTF